MLQDNLVGEVTQRYLVEFVGVHELIKYIGTEYNGLGNAHLCPRIFVKVGVSHEDVVNEGQTTAFAAQTSISNTGKVGILVKALALEYSYNALILHPSVSYNGIQNNLTVCIHVLQVVPRNILKELRDREEGTTGQPSTYIIMTNVVEQTSGRNSHNVVL